LLNKHDDDDDDDDDEMCWTLSAAVLVYRIVTLCARQVADERFLVLINDLLASGEIPDLFPDDDVENIIGAMRPEVKGMGLYDSRENCWKFFINRVRRTLKVRRRFPVT